MQGSNILNLVFTCFYIVCAIGFCFLINGLTKHFKEVYKLLDAQAERHSNNLLELAKSLKAMEQDCQATAIQLSREGDLIRIEFLSPLRDRKNSFAVKSVLLSEQAVVNLAESLADYLSPDETIN